VRVLIHQPSYFPWLGLLDLCQKADLILWYDTAQYTKNDWRNRNRVRGQNGPLWMTIPVHASMHEQISTVVTASNMWRDNHRNMLKMCYGKAPRYWKVLLGVVEPVLMRKTSNLADIAISSVDAMLKHIGHGRQMGKVSDLCGIGGSTPTDVLISILKNVGANEYLTSDGARDYLEADKIESAGIKVTWHDYVHPVYEQRWQPFVSHLSALDYLFNVEPK
jgi:hypothetical protein